MIEAVEHKIVIEGPISYPGGKNGMFRAVCEAGDYRSGYGTEKRVSKHGADHVRGKQDGSARN